MNFDSCVCSSVSCLACSSVLACLICARRYAGRERLLRRRCHGPPNCLRTCVGSQKMRKEAAKIPQKTLDQAQAKIAGCFTPSSSSASIEAGKLLYTEFVFQINRLCGNLEFSAEIPKALISISWDGCNSHKGVLLESVVQNDTSTFKWKEAEGSGVESSIGRKQPSPATPAENSAINNVCMQLAHANVHAACSW